MEKIPAKDRFSKHAKISEVSPEDLKEAISEFGLSPDECEIRILGGGFMNANFMVASGQKTFVFRVYSSDRDTAEREKDLLQFLRSFRDTRNRFRNLVRDKWNLVSRAEPLRQLVHSDFNPKNIMVSKGPDSEVSAILDWEFCLSGNGLIDIGNFFRFSYDYAPDAHVHFGKGYRSVNRQLPPEWIDISRLLDLGNMCSFLARKEDYAESFRTARAVIKSTLHHFGY